MALTGRDRRGLLDRASAAHRLMATTEHDEALRLARETGPDVLVLDAGAAGAREVAVLVREDPDLLSTGSVALLDDPADVAAWTDAVDDVLLSAHAAAELGPRLRSAARLAALRGELHARTVALEQLAYTDALTALPNRRYLEGRLAALLSAARRHDHALTVLLCDLDRFKQVNDTLGHAVGDRLLVAAAEGMRRRLRSEDVVGRWAGDEFLAVLPETGAAAARASAERLRIAVTRELRAVAPEIGVGLSVGIASWDGQEPPEDLVRRADLALYDAKRAGRDQVVVGATLP